MGWWRDRQARRAALREAAQARRWVLIDTETSGLDPRRDRLIALAGVGIALDGGAPALRVADSIELVLACPPDLALDEVARRNILLHGVGRGEQGEGLPPDEGLRRLLDWCDGAPCLAFHAAFDAAMLERACRESLGQGWPLPWLDLAEVARALYPALPHRQLDDWLAQFGLAAGQRHRASSDAWVTAELLQRLWPRWTADARGRAPWAHAQLLLQAGRWARSP